MQQKIYKLNKKVWKWPGDSPWHFVTLPKEMYEEIRKKCGKGMIPIRTTIGKTTWDNSLFPHSMDGTYILAVKKMVRQKECIFEGDEVKVKFELRE